MLSHRIITGLLFLPVFYLVVWNLPPEYFMLLLLVASGIGQFEFYRLARNSGTRPLAALGIALGSLLVYNFFEPVPPELGIGFLVTSFMIVVAFVRLFSPAPVKGALEDMAVTLLGIVYVAMLFGFQGGIRLSGNGKQWLVFMYLVIWAADIGAYSAGMTLGKHRLYEKISPKKSVEGLIGGLIAAAGAALFCRWWFMPPVGVWDAAALALVLASAGTLGDLVESLLKRAAGVKDSGSIIWGHGGMLDRMDSMLFAAPVLYYYLRMR